MSPSFCRVIHIHEVTHTRKRTQFFVEFMYVYLRTSRDRRLFTPTWRATLDVRLWAQHIPFLRPSTWLYSAINRDFDWKPNFVNNALSVPDNDIVEVLLAENIGNDIKPSDLLSNEDYLGKCRFQSAWYQKDHPRSDDKHQEWNKRRGRFVSEDSNRKME